MKDDDKGISPSEFQLEIKGGLRMARPFFLGAGVSGGAADELDLIAETLVRHLERCGIRFTRRTRADLPGPGTGEEGGWGGRGPAGMADNAPLAAKVETAVDALECDSWRYFCGFLRRLAVVTPRVSLRLALRLRLRRMMDSGGGRGSL